CAREDYYGSRWYFDVW
nr:immunoglobulin heavy chain junction region [Mus musculus]NSM04752.1 immunoglobulin heavy chain junction region [Mus musculus]NSM05620.1 immunoglobulin heavy chain junction region [Mus musculus]NSM06172.1 immunoglobulin heavy chain junction region [Mus musculus]NSM06562.1 immunoglobulin heavy chain junction region [Mus musculus]